MTTAGEQPAYATTAAVAGLARELEALRPRCRATPEAAKRAESVAGLAARAFGESDNAPIGSLRIAGRGSRRLSWTRPARVRGDVGDTEEVTRVCERSQHRGAKEAQRQLREEMQEPVDPAEDEDPYESNPRRRDEERRRDELYRESPAGLQAHKEWEQRQAAYEAEKRERRRENSIA